MECSYRVTEAALTYMNEQGLSEAIRQRLLQETPTEISTRKNWQRHLDALKIEDERHLRIATEGALLDGLLEKGFNPELAIISDGPGQFAILLHGVCWIHAERLIHKLIPMNDLQRDAIATVRDQIWSLYADLKAYKQQPDATVRPTFVTSSRSVKSVAVSLKVFLALFFRTNCGFLFQVLHVLSVLMCAFGDK